MRRQYFVILFFILYILYPMHLFGQAENPQKPNKVEVVGGLVTVNVEDADLTDVLKKIEKGTGVKIAIVKELEGKRITANFKNLDAESALRKLLGNNYVFVFAKEKDKYLLKEVMTASDAIGSRIAKGEIITKEIAYGKGKTEVGAVIGPEGSSGGPLSFAVDDKGNIYICDTLNKRIQVFSSRGEYLFTIPIKKAAADIAVDRDGFIYVYADIGKLYQYDKNGNLVDTIKVDERRWEARGEMHIRNNKIYVDASDQTNVLREFLIAEIIDSSLTVPRDEEFKKPIDKGYGETGKRYKFKNFIKGENVEVEIIDRDSASFKTVSFPLEGIDSIEFFGEDQNQNFYIKTNSEEDGKLIMEVHKFNANGDYINTIQMPKGDIEFWSIKNYAIGKDGTIYQFLPEKDKLKLNIFHSESN